MANKFEVQVVALDRFTAVFRNLNNASSKAVRPLTNTQRQVAALFREMHLPELTRGFTQAGRAAQTLAQSVGAASGPLQALFGFGAAGFLVGAIAGVSALTASWARAGFEVNRTSSMIGVGAKELQTYRGGAQLAGVPVDAMTSSLAALAQTLQDAAYGRNPAALMMLSKLGLNLRRNERGVIDTVGTLEDLARALSRISDPQTRRVVASAFGLEEALPLLVKGPEEIARLGREAEKLGLVQGQTALNWANEFALALFRLSGAMTGVQNKIGAMVGPEVLRVMDYFTTKMQLSPTDAALSGMKDFALAGPRLIGSLFGGEELPNRRRASGVVMDSDGGPIRAGTPAFADQLHSDIQGGAQFSSPEVLQRLTQTVEVRVNVANAPPGTTVTTQSTGVPVKVSRSGDMQ